MPRDGTVLAIDPLDPRWWPDDLPYRRLYLSDRDEDKWCLIDAADWDWAQRWKWRINRNQWGMPYAVRTLVCGAHFYIHREVLARKTKGRRPSPEHVFGDHRNGDTLDCRRSNLRWATRAMNDANRKGTKHRWRMIAN